jgi:hypothetical protein
MSDREIQAKNAQALLENPLLTETLDRIQAETVESWMKTRPDATQERERLWLRSNVVTRFREELNSIVDNAKFDAHRVERKPLP